MKRLFALALAFAPAGSLFADIISFKDGSILECKIVKDGVIKDNKQYMLVEDEQKRQREIAVEDIAELYKCETSWDARARNQKWYADQKEKVKDTWSAHASFSRQCRQRKLDAEALAHAQKAYELRQAESKDNMEAHDQMARWLEKDLQLYDEAAKEYRIVYDFKKAKAGDKDTEHVNLGRWCETKSLYDEAEAEFQEALKINPKNSTATQALQRLAQARDVMVNAPIFRTVKEEVQTAVNFYKTKQDANGAYGADVKEAGVQGHRGMTAIMGMALISSWEFEGVEKGQSIKTPPAQVGKVLEFILASEIERKALRGPDVWGNIWSIGFLTRCYKKPQFKDKKEQIKAKIDACIGALTRQMGPDGGWMYYDFARKTSASFVGQAAINHMLDAKEAGIAIPDQLVERAAQHLASCKQSAGIFMYRSTVKQTVEGSAARAPGCEMALVRAGKGSKADLALAVENFFKYRHIIEKIKGKKGTHMGTGGTAPYYFLYGHYWCSRAVKELDKGLQGTYQARMRDLILQDQEDDGSFFDWPLTKPHKEYGAALGALILYELATLKKESTSPVNLGR